VGGANRILRTENSRNPVADYQHKKILAPPPLESTTPSADNAPSAIKILTEVRKILDPPQFKDIKCLESNNTYNINHQFARKSNKTVEGMNQRRKRQDFTAGRNIFLPGDTG
jgi:hypothetical protein